MSRALSGGIIAGSASHDAEAIVTGQLVFLLGEPGAGKSTLLRAYLRERYTVLPERYQPILHTPLLSADDHQAVVLGRLDGPYAGTDALPHDAETAALRFVARRPAPMLYAEGLRLASDAFLRGAEERGYVPLVVWLSVPPHVAEARIHDRTQPAGDANDPAWRARQRQRVRRVGKRHAVAVLNGRESVAVLVEQLASVVCDGRLCAPITTGGDTLYCR